ncbi:MAG: hypothetical protein H0U00_10760 [Actinobacteria bacterium]|nr:hypothetical protein [Actinomycetota bacterium]
MIARSRDLMGESGEWIWIECFWLAFVHMWRGDAIAAEHELRPGYDALKEIGEKSHFSSLSHALSNALYLQGRYDEAELVTRECEEACRANDVHSQILWRSIRAKIFARRRAFDHAEQLARDAIELAETSDFLLAHADGLSDLTEVLELAGRREDAARTLADSIGLYERKGNLLAAETGRIRLAALKH